MIRYFFDKEKHLHTLDGKPLTGTSTVMSVLSKPLTWWASGLAVSKFGWLDPKKNMPEAVKLALEEGYKRIMTLTIDEYKTLLNEAYRAHSEVLKDSAEKGVDLHQELEDYVKGEMGLIEKREYDKKIQPFIEWSKKNVENFIWSEIHCFSEKAWTGGISDCGAMLKNGNVAIIDFKSSREAYPSHFFQIGGYDLQITSNGGWSADGEKILTLPFPIKEHIVVPFGAKEPYPIVSMEIKQNKEGFKNCLSIYRILNKMQND